jgi:hypothetical protein
LPKEGEKVLVAAIPNTYVEIDYVSYPKDGNIWELSMKELITHWMPLPKSPEK